MGKPRAQLSVQISLFVEKDEEEAGEKKKCLNNAIFHPISLLENWHSQTADWSLGVLGYYIYDYMELVIIYYVSVYYIDFVKRITYHQKKIMSH